MGKKRFQKFLACLLILAMTAGIFNSYTADAAVKNDTIKYGYSEAETIYPSDAGQIYRLYSGSDKYVKLKSGNYDKWIDRIIVPEYALDFYNKLSDEAFWTDDTNFTVNGSTWIERSSINAIKFSDVKVQGTEEEFKARMKDEAFLMRAVFDAFDRDHPEVFWLDGTTTYQYSWKMITSGNTTTYNAELYLVLKNDTYDIRRQDYTAAGTVKKGISQRNNAVNNILSEISSTDSIYQQIKYFNRRLTKSNTYNTEVSKGNTSAASEYAWECISALLGNTGSEGPVCEGYARAFKVLCDRSGIGCILVDGSAVDSYGNAGDHMWNYVKIGSLWYGADVTWNDPVVRNVEKADSGYEREDYLCVGSDTVIRNTKFIDSHPVTNSASEDGVEFINGPVLSKTEYDPLASPEPTVEPTAEPTLKPTQKPTQEPTAGPTAEPTAEPTAKATSEPTAAPTPGTTAEATAEPTAAPTPGTTAEPTAEATAEPTAEPTQEPTTESTAKPTAEPTPGTIPGPTAGSTNQEAADENKIQRLPEVYIHPPVTAPANELVLPGSILECDGNRYMVTSSDAENKTVAFIGITGNRSALSIPDTIVADNITYFVTSISDKALKGNKKLKKAVIGSNIVSIGKQAFMNCRKLKKITILSLNIKIGKKAFYGIYGKAKIYIPEKKFAAYKKMLKKSKIKSGVKIKKR